jgi:ABC-type antimicrobial peptide transport system ATPase subunit
MTEASLLKIDDLVIAYRSGNTEQRLVQCVSLEVRRGEVVALVGESGSGKTTTAQAILGLLADNGRIERGAIRLNGTDISGWSQRRLEAIRGARIALIPQDLGVSGISCVSGHDGKEGAPPWPDEKTLRYRMPCLTICSPACRPVPPSSRAVCWIS